MTTIEILKLIKDVKEEIHIFERPSADNSMKMLEIIEDALENNFKLKIDK